ncbi:hypothetical protein VTN77DRAFT_20 [Rasamsonia byssochlamydoides]|uniref:uncharacterized protein n=1 Tax=Rasamsonia byssochlamydoides TaxID=89139 RepID=UPI003743B32E
MTMRVNGEDVRADRRLVGWKLLNRSLRPSRSNKDMVLTCTFASALTILVYLYGSREYQELCSFQTRATLFISIFQTQAEDVGNNINFLAQFYSHPEYSLSEAHSEIILYLGKGNGTDICLIHDAVIFENNEITSPPLRHSLSSTPIQVTVV